MIFMKTKLSLFAVLCLIGMAACNQGDPNAEVTAFANRFASYVAQNQLDSIRTIYPDAAECDSFALNFVADSLRVTANDQDGTFTVNVGNGADFVVAKDKDGNMSVASSHGLVAFNADDLAFAKSVGQYKDGLTDVQQARRMGVKEFKESQMFNFNKELNAKVTASQTFKEIKLPEFAADEGISAVTVTNKTNVAIDGSDYVIDIFADGQHGNGSYHQKGKNIPAGGSTTIQFSYAGNTYPTGALLTFTIPDEQLFVKYFKATGSEFDEYLKANDLDLDAVANTQKSVGEKVADTSTKADDDTKAEQLIRTFYDKYVFGDGDFSAVTKKYCTEKLLKKLAADYDFEDGGYAIWDFRSGEQEGAGKSEIKSIKRVREGLVYEVEMLDMGHPHTALVTLIKAGTGDILFDDVK